MRLLHVTDTHLGMVRRVRGGPPGWQRSDDHYEALRTALLPALRGEVDAVVHSGDLFNRSRPPARDVVRGAELLVAAARACPVVVLPGNHDRRGLIRYLPHALPSLHVCDAPARVEVAGVALGIVPFFRAADTWAEAARQVCAPGVDLLVAHQAFDGARVPGLTFRVDRQRDTIGARHLPPGVRHVLCGHIHPRQVTVVGEAEVVQPGSTERTAFSERAQTKGYAIWTLERTVGWRFVDLPARPMVRVDGAADLAGIAPGALVRLCTDDVDERAVQARGGWLVGPPPDWVPAPRPDPQQAPAGEQLALF